MREQRLDAAPGARALEHVGVTAVEERVYVTLLEHPGSTLAQLVASVELPKRRMQTILRSLEHHGLVSRSPERIRRYMPSPPTLAVDALIAQRQEGMQQTRLATAQLEGRLPSHP